MNTQQLFDSLASRSAYVDRRGWAHTRCPQCFKEPYSTGGRRASHFSFGYDRTKGSYYGHCFACGFSCGLNHIAAQFGIAAPSDASGSRQRPQEPRKPAQWTTRPHYYLDRYLAHPQRLDLWQSYKPLTLETIARFQLGIGVLPASQCRHSRLVVPVFATGTVVGFRGRAYLPDDDDAKWLTCGSSQTALYNADLLVPGIRTVIVAENMIDCLLAMQRWPDVVAVASTAGVATWRDAWTQHIRAARPREVIVWCDHDLAGNGSRWHYRELVAAWRADVEQRRQADPRLQALPFPSTPEPHGPRIAQSLAAERLPVSLYEWPKGTPPKADLAWALA